ncbi:MAG TPA: ferric reductase-like transmembrane domain-containing protein [Solirubrobacteraceae bacterium]|nr:ferric reductase-like transmembrane domain-containing protein [Solirubrobacteraceae bacterium]
MSHGDPTRVVWWLVSRASGIIALVLISLSVVIGLAMATKVLRRPGLKRACARLHEHVALVALVAIAVHGLALLGDHWLKPGLRGIAVPFAIGYRTQFIGLGIIAGYLTLLLGPSFYLRRRIGPRRWRALHRGTVLIWMLTVIHTIGAGSDAQAMWMRGLVLLSGIPIAYLLTLRFLQTRARNGRGSPRRTGVDGAANPHDGRVHGGTGAARGGRAAIEPRVRTSHRPPVETAEA